jgi:hypothetical protein
MGRVRKIIASLTLGGILVILGFLLIRATRQNREKESDPMKFFVYLLAMFSLVVAQPLLAVDTGYGAIEHSAVTFKNTPVEVYAVRDRQSWEPVAADATDITITKITTSVSPESATTVRTQSYDGIGGVSSGSTTLAELPHEVGWRSPIT